MRLSVVSRGQIRGEEAPISKALADARQIGGEPEERFPVDHQHWRHEASYPSLQLRHRRGVLGDVLLREGDLVPGEEPLRGLAVRSSRLGVNDNPLGRPVQDTA